MFFLPKKRSFFCFYNQNIDSFVCRLSKNKYLCCCFCSIKKLTFFCFSIKVTSFIYNLFYEDVDFAFFFFCIIILTFFSIKLSTLCVLSIKMSTFYIFLSKCSFSFVISLSNSIFFCNFYQNIDFFVVCLSKNFDTSFFFYQNTILVVFFILLFLLVSVKISTPR